MKVCQLRSKFVEWPFEIETQGQDLGQRHHRLNGAEQSKQMIINCVAQSLNDHHFIATGFDRRARKKLQR